MTDDTPKTGEAEGCSCRAWFFGLSLLLLVTVGYLIYRETQSNRPYRQYQKKYRELFPQAKGKLDWLGFRIGQVVDGGHEDRCLSCHIGMVDQALGQAGKGELLLGGRSLGAVSQAQGPHPTARTPLRFLPGTPCGALAAPTVMAQEANFLIAACRRAVTQTDAPSMHGAPKPPAAGVIWRQRSFPRLRGSPSACGP